MESNKKGIIFLFLAALLWSLTAFFSRQIYSQGTNVFTLAWGSNLIVTSCLLIFCNKKINFNINKKDFKGVFLVALFSTVAFVTTLAAFKYTKIANAEFLHYTMPLFALGLAVWLLKERLSLIKILFVSLSILGIFLVFVEGLDFRSSLLGDVLALVSAIFFALSIIFAKKIKYLGPYTINFWHVLIACILLTPLFIIFFTSLNSVAIFYILLAGIIAGFIGVLFYYKGLMLIEASIASVILLFEAVSASAIAWLLLGESLTWLSIAGGVLILASSAGLFLRMKKV